MMTLEQFRDLIRDEAERVGGQHELARLCQVDDGHLSNVLAGRRWPGPKIEKYFKVRRVPAYVEQA